MVLEMHVDLPDDLRKLIATAEAKEKGHRYIELEDKQEREYKQKIGSPRVWDKIKMRVDSRWLEKFNFRRQQERHYAQLHDQIDAITSIGKTAHPFALKFLENLLVDYQLISENDGEEECDEWYGDHKVFEYYTEYELRFPNIKGSLGEHHLTVKKGGCDYVYQQVDRSLFAEDVILAIEGNYYLRAIPQAIKNLKVALERK